MTQNSTRAVPFAVSAHPWCRDVRGVAYTFEQFRERIAAFHGYPAPGLFIGGKMVDLALAALPAGCLFDAIAETGNCLPDAIQMLTPCTVGNGWLKVMDLGRFALSLYDKHRGEGVRVFMHPQKVSAWKQIDRWFFKRAPKAEQDGEALLQEIRQAGAAILHQQAVRIDPHIMVEVSVGQRAICPHCGESYPLKHGDACRACQGPSPYMTA